MSNPWPVSPPWPVTPVQPPKKTLVQALLEWDTAKKALETAKETEMAARKLAFELGFGADANEGTNTVELANGYELKGVRKVNYSLCLPPDFKGDITDAVAEVSAKFTRISNEGGFLADRLFKWSVDINATEYKKLVDEAKDNEIKRRLLLIVNDVVTSKDAAPTLTIKEPKGKKK